MKGGLPSGSITVPPLYGGQDIAPLLDALGPSTVAVVGSTGRRLVERLGRPWRILPVGSATADEVARLQSELPPEGDVVAIGGGRVLDTAKVVARGSLTAGALAIPGRPGRLIAVPTTCGSGSDASAIAVIEVEGHKRAFRHPALRPDAIVFLPEVLATLDRRALQAHLFDTLAHLLEGGCSPLARGVHLAAAALYLPRVLGLLEKDPWTDPDRESALFLATMAGAIQDVTSVGLAHGLAHVLEPRCGLGHGELLAAFIGPVFRFNREKSCKPDQLFQLAGLDPVASLDRIEAIATAARFVAPPIPRDEEFCKLVVRDVCTRTNCRLVRAPELLAVLDSLC